MVGGLRRSHERGDRRVQRLRGRDTDGRCRSRRAHSRCRMSDRPSGLQRRLHRRDGRRFELRSVRSRMYWRNALCDGRMQGVEDRARRARCRREPHVRRLLWSLLPSGVRLQPDPHARADVLRARSRQGASRRVTGPARRRDQLRRGPQPRTDLRAPANQRRQDGWLCDWEHRRADVLGSGAQGLERK